MTEETMEIKDLKLGQTLWKVRFDKKTGYEYVPFKISRVGRKYVYINDGWETKCGKCVGAENILIEADKDWGSPEYLYLTEQDARESVEKKELEEFFAKMDFWQVRKYSLEQLRKAAKILKGENENEGQEKDS